ncbi:2096_t:CDS:2, partial [Rhizophagus irregularis]
ISQRNQVFFVEVDVPWQELGMISIAGFTNGCSSVVCIQEKVVYIESYGCLTGIIMSLALGTNILPDQNDEVFFDDDDLSKTPIELTWLNPWC